MIVASVGGDIQIDDKDYSKAKAEDTASTVNNMPLQW